MNYPSCFYGGEHCVDLPYWLLFLVSGLLISFVMWNFIRYKNGKTKHLMTTDTRKEIFKIIGILLVVGVLVPWLIQVLLK